jgi:hypothetical protein
MASVATNIATIQTQAAVLDGLITSFLASRALILAAETEIRQAQPGANHEVRAGRVRLWEYAIMRMSDPSASKTVAALASEAWSGVS